MRGLGGNHRCRGKAVKISVMPDHKRCHPIFRDVPLDRRLQSRPHTLRRIPMPDKKQVFIISPLLFGFAKYILFYLVIPNMSTLFNHIIQVVRW